jgi:hypothetical protein
VVRAGPVLLGLQVGGVLAQALSVVGCWAYVTTHQLTPVPAHLQPDSVSPLSEGVLGGPWLFVLYQPCVALLHI